MTILGDMAHEKYHQIARTQSPSATLMRTSVRRHAGSLAVTAAGGFAGGCASALAAGSASASAYVSPATLWYGGAGVARLTPISAAVQIAKRSTAKCRKL